MKHSVYCLAVFCALPPTQLCAEYDHRTFRDSGAVFSGLHEVIEGVEHLLNRQEKSGIESVNQMIVGIGHLVAIVSQEHTTNEVERMKLKLMILGFRQEILDLVQHNYELHSRDDAQRDAEVEQQKMVEGLTTILYNLLSILINPKDMGNYLSNILGGLYKIISAVLADGKITREDLDNLLKALYSIFCPSENSATASAVSATEKRDVYKYSL